MVIDIYAAMGDGVWFYEQYLSSIRTPISALTRVCKTLWRRLRSISSTWRTVSACGTFLLRTGDAGFIGQNVYLFCASEGLGSVFRGAVDQQKLAQKLKLPAGQFVTFAQTVGYPTA